MYVLMVYVHGEGYSRPVVQSHSEAKLRKFAEAKKKEQLQNKTELKDHDLDWECYNIEWAREVEEIKEVSNGRDDHRRGD